MRVAIVHDFACQRGGAERVVLSLCRLLADPVVVTSLYVPEATYPELGDYEVRAARVGTARDAKRFRARALSYAREFRAFDVSDTGLAIVSSSAFAHHVRHPRSLVYWHTPPRFLYDPSAYVGNPVLAGALRTGLTPVRRGDRRAALAHQGHAATSRRTAARLKDAYGIDASVIHPPLDLDRLGSALTDPTGGAGALVVSRLLPYKRVDVAIKACALAGVPLTIVGAGPEGPNLRALAGTGPVRFLEAVSDAELAELYATSAVVLSPAIDDFGYVPIEAAYAGRPVVAASAGRTNENVRDGRTGRLVEGFDEADWAEALVEVLATPWSPETLRAHAVEFGHERFASQLREWLAPFVDPDTVLREAAGAAGAGAAGKVGGAAVRRPDVVGGRSMPLSSAAG